MITLKRFISIVVCTLLCYFIVEENSIIRMCCNLSSHYWMGSLLEILSRKLLQAFANRLFVDISCHWVWVDI